MPVISFIRSKNSPFHIRLRVYLLFEVQKSDRSKQGRDIFFRFQEMRMGSPVIRWIARSITRWWKHYRLWWRWPRMNQNVLVTGEECRKRPSNSGSLWWLNEYSFKLGRSYIVWRRASVRWKKLQCSSVFRFMLLKTRFNKFERERKHIWITRIIMIVPFSGLTQIKPRTVIGIESHI